MNCVYTIRPPEPGILYTVLEFVSFELEGTTVFVVNDVFSLKICF